jgi:tRNA dimethylallyltransferase
MQGEIICVDSMQVYRGLDVGTAKPSGEERARVPHHLLDIRECNQPFDAAQFVGLARQAVTQIQERRRLPILCGGTGLYLKAYLHGLGKAPPPDLHLRAELEGIPLPTLLDELAARDPVAFSTIDRRNPRRVIRALEILRRGQGSLREQQADWSKATNPETPTPPAILFALARPVTELRRRIDERVEQMFRRGLVDETSKLPEAKSDFSPTALQALGYRQVLEHLRGERTLPDTIALVKQRTRQFAKRQLTWLRHQLDVEWVNWSAEESAASVAERVEHLFRTRTSNPSGTTGA